MYFIASKPETIDTSRAQENDDGLIRIKVGSDCLKYIATPTKELAEKFIYGKGTEGITFAKWVDNLSDKMMNKIQSEDIIYIPSDTELDLLLAKGSRFNYESLLVPFKNLR